MIVCIIKTHVIKMKKSLSAPNLQSLGIHSRAQTHLVSMVTNKKNSISCNSLATLASDIAISHQLEVVTHAPAYKIGMCVAEALYNFPSDILSINTDLATCIMTPDESVVPTPIYEPPHKHPRIYDNETRAGDLMMRVRKNRRRDDESGNRDDS